MRFFQFCLMASLTTFTSLGLGQTLQTIHSFQGSDGAAPNGYLTLGNDGHIYGFTSRRIIDDGNYSGVFFRMPTNGALITLGLAPAGGSGKKIVQGNDGQFYGTSPRLNISTNGGIAPQGTVFKIATDGGLTTLVEFNEINGEFPEAGVTMGSDGNFYGTTQAGGTYHESTAFKMTPSGLLTSLISLHGRPLAALVQGSNGNFYGTTVFGTNGYGSVFEITPNGVLVTFASFNGSNGRSPSGVIQGTNGNFYGTTQFGGTNDLGTVFQLTPWGGLTSLVSFDGTNGAQPMGELMQAMDGNFYGMTHLGGANNLGTVFRISTNGILTTLVSFNGINGGNPTGQLIQTSNGIFYGTTSSGGVSNYGTIFWILPVSLNFWVSGNELVLSWPTNEIGFTLQATPDLASLDSWANSTNFPFVVDGKFTVTNSISGNMQFYRLKK